MNENVNDSALWHEESSDDDSAESLDNCSLSKWAKCNAGPKCYHCQKYGHYAFACPRKFRNRVVEGLDETLVKPLLNGIRNHYVTEHAMTSYLKAKPSVNQCIVLRYKMIRYHLGSIDSLVSYIESHYDEENPQTSNPLPNPPLRNREACKFKIVKLKKRPVVNSVKSSSQKDKPIASKAETKIDRRCEKKVKKVSQVCKAINEIKINEKKFLEEEKNKVELDARMDKAQKNRSWELFRETFTKKVPIVKYNWVTHEEQYEPKWKSNLPGATKVKSYGPEVNPAKKTITKREKEYYTDGYRTIPPDPNNWYLDWEVDANAIIDYLQSHNVKIRLEDLDPASIKGLARGIAKNQIDPVLQNLIDNQKLKEVDPEEKMKQSFYGLDWGYSCD